MDDVLCLIKPDKWVPSLSHFLHLELEHIDHNTCQCIGAPKPRPNTLSRPPSPSVKRDIELKLKIDSDKIVKMQNQ